MKKRLKIIGMIPAVILILIAVLFAVLTITEYKPKDVEEVIPEGQAAATFAAGQELTVVTWNTGYGALGDNADFFMDGGTGVRTADKARVQSNMTHITSALNSLQPDLCFLQEVDIKSSRSYRINEADWLREGISFEAASAFAYNYHVLYVPYPTTPIGHVESGILTLSAAPIVSAERIQLPCPFSWPVRLGNLRRCLLVTRIPVKGTDRELVAVNLHLEAYDDGEGKIAQTQQLAALLKEEADKGNYVIAGGDFNQLFSNVDASAYPVYEGKWQPGVIEADVFDASLTLLMDNRVPSCRSLDQPYAGADHSTFQYYLIDGFIVSSNVDVSSVETQSLDFEASDHNPVVMKLTLAP